MKNAAENKKPATSEIAGGGLPKSELCLSYVGRITHPRQRWFSQQQAHSRQLLARVQASMSRCYLRPTTPSISDAGESEKIHCYQGLSPPPSIGKRGPIVPSTPPQIDGRHFINPVFENVTPEYNGTGSVEMDNAKFIGTIRAYSSNNAVMQALATAPPGHPERWRSECWTVISD